MTRRLCPLPVKLFVATLLVFQAAGLQAQTLKEETLRQIQIVQAEKAARTPVQRKIASQLLQAIKEARGEIIEGVKLRPVRLPKDSRGNIEVDIATSSPTEITNRIKTAGGTVIYASAQYKTLRAAVPLAQVEAIAAWPEIQFIEPAAQAELSGNVGLPVSKGKSTGAGPTNPSIIKRQLPTPAERKNRIKQAVTKFLQQQEYNPLVLHTGDVNSQADAAHGADQVRNRYGAMGQGIKIGVLSDSYNAKGGATTDVANGELPGTGNPLGNTTPVTVVQDLAGRTDEGRAMLQLIHDIAPKAQLFFATASGFGPAGFANNILALRNNYNCDIIVDDVGYSNEPAFQDGIIAQAVNTVTADGALYFSSAANSGSVAKGTAGVWEGDFNDVGSPAYNPGYPGTIHNFGTTASPVNGDIITAAGSDYSLKWADPAGASTNDYDLFLVDAAGTVVSVSNGYQNGTQDPYEAFSAPDFYTGDRLVVFKESGDETRAFRLDGYRSRLTVATTGQTYGHSSAIDAYSVAATPAARASNSAITPVGPYPGVFTATNQVEDFSSDGLRRMFFNADGSAITPGNFLFGTNGGVVRRKPDITAADGTSTTVTGFKPFYGTSAAAPHAGAIAALLKSAKPSLTPAQIRTALTNTALDIESTGYDNLSGYGIIQALQAVQSVSPTALATLNVGSVTFQEPASGGNGNRAIDPGEVVNVFIPLLNPSLANATGVTATLTTATPDVTVIQNTYTYGSINASSSRINPSASPFVIGVKNTVPCGTVIRLLLNVSFGGGYSPLVLPFTLNVGNQPFANGIAAKLNNDPVTGSGFTFATGQQTGRIARNSISSTCASLTATPTLNTTTGSRQYNAYTFTNPSGSSQCVTVTLNAADLTNIYTVAYNSSGFVPASPNTNYLAEPDYITFPLKYSFTVGANQAFTVVVHDVNAGAASGTSYNLSVSLSTCTAGRTCTPIALSPATIANGTVGSAYSQAFTATGGSGYYTFSASGELPNGLSISGNTLTGTPTEAGTFPIAITAGDTYGGCPSDTRNYSLVISGNAPAAITAQSGTPQTASPSAVFSLPLKAYVTNASNAPVAGVPVVFTAPATGASGTFDGGSLLDTVLTGSDGVATSSAFTANSTAGSYTVSAKAKGLATTVGFNLTNGCTSTFIVTSSADSGPGTLRAALTSSCAPLNITFDPNVTSITLTSGPLEVAKSVTINGGSRVSISGNNNSTIFLVYTTANGNTNSVSISGLSLKDARSTYSGGGAIYASGSGTFILTDCSISNCKAVYAGGKGGAIYSELLTCTINRCTIANNSAVALGGGISNGIGNMTITNSTIVNNSTGTSGMGGGLALSRPFSVYSNITLINSTIANNSATSGGNIYQADNTTLSLKNSIVSGGMATSGPDVFGTVTSNNYNLIQNTSGASITGTTTNNITGINAQLLPLDDYDTYPTPVCLPMSTSPVINSGDPALTSSDIDQRQKARRVGSGSDIGAVEAIYSFSAATPNQSANIFSAFSQPIRVLVRENGIPVAGDTLTFIAPANGATGTFTGGLSTVKVVTDASGYATAPTFTANGVSGSFNVIVTVGSSYNAVIFNLNNICPATYTVTSNADSGPGTLREVLSGACTGLKIVFDNSITSITLASQLIINKAVQISGNNRVTISGNNVCRVFDIEAGTDSVSISGLTIRDANPPSDVAYPAGGAILIKSGRVGISNCYLTNNTSLSSYYREGGAIDIRGGSLSLQSSTLSGNTATNGGAINNYGGSLLVNNCTIANNAGLNGNSGGGIHGYQSFTITNSTIVNNTASRGGNLAQVFSDKTLTMGNTIVAGGTINQVVSFTAGPDIYTENRMISTGYNLVQNTSNTNITGTTTGNITGVAPNLLPLANYGGYSYPICIPTPNSPAINAGNPALTTADADQRGKARRVGSSSDMGAIETSYVFSLLSGSNQSAGGLSAFANPLRTKLSESDYGVPGNTVVFTAPSSGASGTFSGALTATAVTDADGYTTAPMFTANNTRGTYNVAATIGSQFSAVNFSLTNATVLPVVWGGVSATTNNCTVQLQWKTLTELNNSSFTIEYSTDGNRYSSLATIAATGNGTTEQQYAYTHTSPAVGVGYYRIKQMDQDGNFSYSKVLSVVNNCEKAAIAAYPNPVKDKLTVQLPATLKGHIAIYDATGRQMVQLRTSGGMQEVDTKAWAKGIYNLSVVEEGRTTYSLKIVKE